jgi:hypothetical protein
VPDSYRAYADRYISNFGSYAMHLFGIISVGDRNRANIRASHLVQQGMTQNEAIVEVLFALFPPPPRPQGVFELRLVVERPADPTDGVAERP